VKSAEEDEKTMAFLVSQLKHDIPMGRAGGAAHSAMIRKGRLGLRVLLKESESADEKQLGYIKSRDFRDRRSSANWTIYTPFCLKSQVSQGVRSACGDVNCSDAIQSSRRRNSWSLIWRRTRNPTYE